MKYQVEKNRTISLGILPVESFFVVYNPHDLLQLCPGYIEDAIIYQKTSSCVDGSNAHVISPWCDGRPYTIPTDKMVYEVKKL